MSYYGRVQFLDFLDWRIYGATVTRWLLALATLFGVYLVLLLGQRFFKNRVGPWAAKPSTQWNDLVVQLVAETRWYFLLVAAAEIAAQTLTLRRVLAGGLRSVFVVVALLQLGVWGNGVIAFLAERYTRLKTSGDIGARATVYAIGYGARLALWTLLVITGLDFFNVRVTALLTGLGIGGVAVALAAQNVLGDLFAALAIVLDRPFVLGDFIIVDDTRGTVERIGLKTTRIRSLGGEQIAVANSALLKGRIRNYGRMNERRVEFTLDLTYDTRPDVVAKVPALVRAIVESQMKTRFDRCHFLTFADSSLRFETVYYVLDRDHNVYADIQHAINLEILRRFNADGIEFAFPSRAVYLKGAPPTGSQRTT